MSLYLEEQLAKQELTKDYRRKMDYELGVHNPTRTPISIYVKKGKSSQHPYIAVNRTRGVISTGVYDIEERKVDENSLCQTLQLKDIDSFIRKIEEKKFEKVSEATYSRISTLFFPLVDLDMRITLYCLLWIGFTFSDPILKTLGIKKKRKSYLKYLEEDIKINRYLPRFLILLQEASKEGDLKLSKADDTPLYRESKYTPEFSNKIKTIDDNIRKLGQDFITIEIKNDDSKIEDLSIYLNPIGTLVDDVKVLDGYSKARSKHRQEFAISYLDDYADEMLYFEKKFLYENGVWDIAPTYNRIIEYIQNEMNEISSFDGDNEKGVNVGLMKVLSMVLKYQNSNSIEPQVGEFSFSIAQKSIKELNFELLTKGYEAPDSWEKTLEKHQEMVGDELLQIVKLKGEERKRKIEEYKDNIKENAKIYDSIRNALTYYPLVERYSSSGLLDTQTYDEKLHQSIYIPLSISSEAARSYNMAEHKKDIESIAEKLDKEYNASSDTISSEEVDNLKKKYLFLNTLSGYNPDRVSQGFVTCPLEESCKEDSYGYNCKMYEVFSVDEEVDLR